MNKKFISFKNATDFPILLLQAFSFFSNCVVFLCSFVYYSVCLSFQYLVDFKLKSTLFPQADINEIVEAQKMFELIDMLPLIFKPVVDDFTSDPFVPKDPWKIIEAGEFNQVPLIMGSNSDEGLFSALGYYVNPALLEELSSKWETEYAPLFIFHR